MKMGGIAGGRGSYRRVVATETSPSAVLTPPASVGASEDSRNKRWWIGRKQKSLEIALIARSRPSPAAISLAFVLICIIVYLFIASNSQEQGDGSIHSSNRRPLPSITIFSAPRFNSSFRLHGEYSAATDLAIRSWLDLSPAVSVVLFGDHPSLVHFAGAFGDRVAIESAVDFTFQGAPLFHSMVARAQASDSDISVLVDPDTLLFQDFISAVQIALHLKQDWLLVSIPKSFSLLSFNSNVATDGINFQKLQKILDRSSNSRHCSDRAVLAWNKGNLTLTPKSLVLPPFINGKGFHNQWLIHETLSNELRLIIDSGRSILSFYPEESDSDGSNGSSWERDINEKLASSYGSFYFSPSKNLNLIELIDCSGQHLFYKAAEDVVYFIQQYKSIGRRWKDCVRYESLALGESCSIAEWLKVKFKENNLVDLPFSLESILRIRADENKTVVLAISGNNYRDMLMSWVCRLRHLSVSNFIIGAIDSDIYNFAILQGLPVFRDPLAPTEIGLKSCHFGTKCFQRVTKVKSRIVLQILKMGYNVLLSDVDVYWFQNPLPFLQSFDPPVFLAQSDEFNETGPINLPHKLNSGFYYARADHPTIYAITKVVKHASASNLSEQPSFYKILCGEGGAHRISGTHCREPKTNLTTIFLDRDQFPNGAFKGLWEKGDVRSACKVTGCLVLHNNWLTGREKKVKRQVSSKLWAYDVNSRMCSHDT